MTLLSSPVLMETFPLSQIESAGQLPDLAISAVERQTGLTKDALRVWERRYGFPSPIRNEHGERLYSSSQVDKLRVLKRLIDRGFRPSSLVKRTLKELRSILATSVATDDTRFDPTVSSILEYLRGGDILGLKRFVNRLLAEVGAERFVVDTGTNLLRQLDVEWARGNLEVFEEQGLAQAISALLRNALHTSSTESRPLKQVLTTTLPDDPQALGIVLAEALLTIRGVECISLGMQTPLRDIVLAGERLHVDAVVLAVGTEFAAERCIADLRELRQRLPEALPIWVVTANAAVQRAVNPGVWAVPSLQELGTTAASLWPR